MFGRVREGSAHEAVQLATAAHELLREAEFPQLAIAALTAGLPDRFGRRG